MQKKIWLFFGITLLLSGQVLAGPIESFCQEVTKSHSEKRLSFGATGKFLTKFIFAPDSLIEISKKSSSLEVDKTSSKGKRIAFLLLPEAKLSLQEKLELRALEKSRNQILKRLKKQNFVSKVRKSKDSQECLRLIEENRLVPDLIFLNDMAPKFLSLKQKEIEERTYLEQASKKKYLQKQGWEVFENLNLNEIAEKIRLISPNSVLLITHASNDGRVYDSKKNPLPKTFFSLLGIDNLILYSCYGDEALEYYSFGNFNIFTASPTPFAERVLESAVPLNSLKAISKIKLERLSHPEIRMCLLTLPRVDEKALGVHINGFYLGGTRLSHSFPCSILKDENALEIFSVMKERHLGNSGIFEAYINGRKIHLQDFLTSKNRHIVTKGFFN